MTPVSIKRDVYLYLFGMVLTLTAIYALMVNHSYQVGLNESAKYGFLYELKQAEAEFVETGAVTQTNTFQVFTHLDDVPDKFQKVFDWANFSNDQIYENYLLPSTDEYGHYLYAAKHYVSSKAQYLYVVSQYDEKIYADLLEQHPPESIDQLNSSFVILGVLLLGIFLISRILVYRITKPILELSQWSKDLNLNETGSLQKLRYTEVQRLANQLISSVRHQQAAIEREEFFLRTASHELRTPVTTISASGAMLSRLSPSLSNGGQRAIARINRSVTTMHNLINTLLWMSREKRTPLDLDSFDMEALLLDTVSNHQYLIEGKELTVHIDSPEKLQSKPLPHTLVQIVITNLIRNAFQHSSHGNIHITLASDKISVSNSTEHQSSTSPEPSFGIGLLLIERICANNGWQFTHSEEASRYNVSVHFIGPCSSDI